MPQQHINAHLKFAFYYFKWIPNNQIVWECFKATSIFVLLLDRKWFVAAGWFWTFEVVKCSFFWWRIVCAYYGNHDAFWLHKIEREGTKSTPAVSIMLIRVNTDLLLRKKKKGSWFASVLFLVCICCCADIVFILLSVMMNIYNHSELTSANKSK